MGRHGGINILHQKSWHVWRLDNQLTVERDERRAAAEEQARQSSLDKEAFQAKLATLRARAVGAEEPIEDSHRALSALPTASSSASTPARASRDNTAGQDGSSRSSKEKARNENSYKYGRVTRADLKQAEHDLDTLLKKSRGKQAQAKQVSSPSAEVAGLGTGAHINLFEAAEEAQKHHLAEHQKHVGLTQKGNELAQRPRKALFSDFDEIIKTVPWYARAPTPAEEGSSQLEADAKSESSPKASGSDALASQRELLRSRSRSRSRETASKWTRRREKHGQVVVEVRQMKGGSGASSEAKLTGAANMRSPALPDSGCEPKKEKPKKKKVSSIEALRSERLQREAAERERTTSLLGLRH
mmetsp:Transcript_66162/g.158250  ORF Transcript_66162/g.158250 Transcript_66162/m.158250 type:complete len:358 (+) Transcript_66162:66-1139(+)